MCRQVRFLKTVALVGNPVLCNVCFNVFTVVQLSVVYIKMMIFSLCVFLLCLLPFLGEIKFLLLRTC